MKRPLIQILSGSHLCNNPRVVKEADALAGAGFEVEVLGCLHSDQQEAEDREILAGRPWRYVACADLRGRSPGDWLRRHRWRMGQAIAGQLAKRAGVSTAAQLGGWRRSILRRARARPASLCIVHSAATLWVGMQLWARGGNVGVDMEDWFSREHVAPHPVDLIAGWERFLLGHAAHTSCPSRSMAEALAEAYDCRPPVVVHNSFPPPKEPRVAEIKAPQSVHWFSQTIGPGRGLETLFRAMAHARAEFSVHLRGQHTEETRRWIHGAVSAPLRERITLHRPTTNRALPAAIARFELGFAGELPTRPSYDLTITNKILQYLEAGLPVLASDTRGQREVARAAPDAVFLFPADDAVSLAGHIDRLLASPNALREASAAARAAARTCFGWQSSAERLVRSVENAVSHPRP